MKIFGGIIFMRLVFAFAVLVSPEAKAHSAEEIIDKFRETGEALLKAGKEKGLTKLGGIDIDLLIEEVRAVPVLVMPRNFHVTVGDRQTAMWSKLDQVIRLNHGIDDVDDETLGVLAVHETLGWFYKADKNYELSFGTLWARANDFGDAAGRLQLQDNTSLTTQNQKLIAGGGSTVVGGGGDASDIHWRMSVFRRLSEIHAQQPNLFGGFSFDLVSLSLGRMNVNTRKDVKHLGEIWDGLDGAPEVNVSPEGRMLMADTSKALFTIHLAESYLAAFPADVGLVSLERAKASGTYGDRELLDAMTYTLIGLTMDKSHGSLNELSWRKCLQSFARSRLVFSSHLPKVYVVTPFQNAVVINIDQDKWQAMPAPARSALIREIISSAYLNPQHNSWQTFKASNLWLGSPFTSDLTEALAALPSTTPLKRANLRPLILAIGRGLSSQWKFFSMIGGAPGPIWQPIATAERPLWLDLSKWQTLTVDEKAAALRAILLNQ